MKKSEMIKKLRDVLEVSVMEYVLESEDKDIGHELAKYILKLIEEDMIPKVKYHVKTDDMGRTKSYNASEWEDEDE